MGPDEPRLEKQLSAAEDIARCEWRGVNVRQLRPQCHCQSVDCGVNLQGVQVKICLLMFCLIFCILSITFPKNEVSFNRR